MTQNQIETLMWNHQHAGGGWAIVDKQPNDFVRVISIGPKEIGKQVFLAWVKKLKPALKFIDPLEPKKGTTSWLIPAEAKEKLEILRAKLKEGVVKIVGSHIRQA